MTKQELLNTYGKFTWSLGKEFHVETPLGNFHWSDPEYGGDNSFTPCGTYGEWLDSHNLEFGRAKGTHLIASYCGEDIWIKEDQRNKEG